MTVKKTAETDLDTAMEAATDQAETPATVRALKFGMQGDDVKALQQKLTAKGYNVPASGTFDMDTVKAVRLAQRAKHLPETGIVRPGALEALLS